MILFVFEGEDREPRIYETLEKLFFKKGENIVCSFGNNIYELYEELSENDDELDLVALLCERLKKRRDSRLDSIKRSDISEIYLFFDYDFQNTNLRVQEMNNRIKKMLEKFSEETDLGKLYINYPMVESIRYTKAIPDNNYNSYVVSREECRDFKQCADKFSYYKNFDHILFGTKEAPTTNRVNQIHDNWEHLKKMNVRKANFLVNGANEIPKDKNAINQASLFAAQLEKHIEKSNCVAVLNAFPIFLFDYFK